VKILLDKAISEALLYRVGLSFLAVLGWLASLTQKKKCKVKEPFPLNIRIFFYR